MKRLLIVLLPAAAVLTHTSCGAPHAPINNQPNRNLARAESKAPVGTVPPDTASDAPVSQMRINGETFPADQMWREIGDEILRQRESLPPDAFREWLNRRAVQWMADKITESLIYQQAVLRLPDGAQKNVDPLVDAQLRKIITEQWNGVQRRYEKQLLDQQRSLDDVREKLRREILVSAYLEGQIKPLVAEPTRDELLAIYNANVDSWKKPERRSMSLIEVRVLDFLPPDVSDPTREQIAAARQAARQRIGEAQRKLKEGVSFAEVARQYSTDSRAAGGGDWGWITPEEVRERYLPAVEALSKLQAGQVSDVVVSGDSLFLVRCDEHDPGLAPSFVDVQNELTRQHYRISYNRKLTELIRDLQSTARIEPSVPARYLRAAVEAALDRLAMIDRLGNGNPAVSSTP